MIVVTIKSRRFGTIIAECSGNVQNVDNILAQFQRVLQHDGVSVTLTLTDKSVVVVPRSVLADAVISIKEE